MTLAGMSTLVESAPNNGEVNILVGEGGELREGGLSTVDPVGRRPGDPFAIVVAQVCLRKRTRWRALPKIARSKY